MQSDSMIAQAGALARPDELAQATAAGDRARAGKVDEAAQRFEELLATMLVREMRRGVEQGFFGEGAGSDVFEGWLDETLGRSLARDNIFDLAQSVRVSLGGGAHAQASPGDTTQGPTNKGLR